MPKEIANVVHRLARPKGSQHLFDITAGSQVGDYRIVRDREY